MVTVNAGELLKLVELRFFRDLVDAERVKVFKAFGLLPQDYDEQIPHAAQRKLFYDITSLRQAASQGSIEDIIWKRVNDEPFEYAIQQDQFGDAFVKLLNGKCLRRPIK